MAKRLVRYIFLVLHFFPIIYYSIKLIKKKNLDFLNLVFWLSFGFINSHPGHFSLIFIYILFFFIFNLKNLTYIFKKKIFYFSFLLLIIICSEKIYYLLTTYQSFQTLLRVTLLTCLMLEEEINLVLF